MTTAVDSGAKYLAGLSAMQRAKFFAEVAHDLTVDARAIYHSTAELAQRAADLYDLNEVQHRVTSYISHALGPGEDTGWLVPLPGCVLESTNPRVRQHSRNAWDGVVRRWQAIA